MITDIPASKMYAFSPLKTLAANDSKKHVKLIRIGGVGLMEEIGKLMEDKDVVIVTATPDRCLLFVDFTDIECVDILNRAKAAYDARLGKVLSAEQNS